MLGHYNKRCKKEIDASNYLSSFAVTGMGLKFRIHPIAAAISDEQFDKLDYYLKQRRKIASQMIEELRGLPGIVCPIHSSNIEHGWSAFIIKYKKDQLNNLSIEKFYQALLEEGCKEIDRPNSTCPLNYHALFQRTSDLFPNLKNFPKYGKGDFPKAEDFHDNILKMPVWHDPAGGEIASLYIKAIKKVINNHRELL